MTVEDLARVVIFNSATILVLSVVFITMWILEKRKILTNSNTEFIRVRNIVESFKFVNQPFFVIDENNIVIWANKYTKKMLGYRQSEIIGKSIMTVIDQSSWVSFDKFKKKPYLDDEDVEEEVNHLDVITITKSGKKVLSDIITGTWQDEEKKHIFCTVILRDISYRKANEEVARRLQAHYKLACDLLLFGERILHTGTWEWDMTKDPDEVVYSEGFAIVFDIPFGETVTAKYLMDVVDIDDRDTVNNKIKDAIENNKGYDIQYRIVRRNDRKDLIRCKADVILNENGKVIKTKGVIQLIQEDVD